MRTMLSASTRTLAAAPKAFRVGGQDCLRHSRQFAEMFSGRVAREQIHVRSHDNSYHLVKSHFGFPTENFFAFEASTSSTSISAGRSYRGSSFTNYFQSRSA
jgi:hypothetical protein